MLLPVKKSVLYLLLALCIAAVAVSVVSIVIATRPAEKPVEALFADFYAERLGGEAPDERTLALLAFAGEQARHADTRVPPGADDIHRLLDALMRGEGDA